MAEPVVSESSEKWRVSPDGLVWVTILQVDETSSMGLLRFKVGASVPLHTHESSAEMLYVLSGTGVMEIEGRSYELAQGDAIRIEMGKEHNFLATSDGEVVQVYSPPGPEQRFLQWETLP